MLSIIIDGKVIDYRYKKHTSFSYVFYIGNIYVGQVFRMKKGYWTAVSAKANDLCPVE